ncbi:MAG: DUF3667 domain-containing protein [Acidobacteriota bacterium]|jgi:hypothetical protein
MEHPADVCLTCGATFSGRFCSSCGERAVHHGDLAIGHLFHDFAHEITHVDGRIWGSFLALLFKPGQLTKDYWRGRRGKSLRPLRIFLIVTALSLVLAPDATGPLGMRVLVRADKQGTHLVVGTRPERAMSNAGLGAQGLAEVKIGLDGAVEPEKLAQMTETIHKIYKVIQSVSLTLFAAASFLLGRRVQPYFGAHLIFALHYYSFEYILTGLVDRLHIDPRVPLLGGFFYLVVAFWRLTGKGQSSSQWIGIDFGSLARAMLLSFVVTIIELGLIASSAAIGIWSAASRP